MNRRKTRAAYRISQNAKGHVEDTRPELFFDQFAAYNFPTFEVAKAIPVLLKDDEGLNFIFRPDRIVGGQVYVEIDGPYHRTPRQRVKTMWRDDLVVAHTQKRVLHIDSELLVAKKWWIYLAQKMVAFLLSKESVGHIYA